MPKFKNVSSSGDLDLPLIGRVVKAGEVFEVSSEQAALLAEQPAIWAPAVEKGNN
jgi:hypothetical protein